MFRSRAASGTTPDDSRKMRIVAINQSRSIRLGFSTTRLKVVALLALSALPLSTLAQEQRLSQYAHRAWLMRDGFFSGSPNAITQTTDGYIWIGTASGLFRFDGSRFERWSSPDGRKLPSDMIYGLLGARDGSLWIGMRGGLAHFADRKLSVYPDFHDDVAGLLEDRSGHIWFTRSEAGGALRTPLCQALPTQIHCLDQSDGFAGKSCCSYFLAQDTQGYLWVQTEGPLLRWKPGHFETYLPKEWAETKGIENIGGVIGMPDGSVLVCVTHAGTFGGLQKISMGHWESVKVPGFDSSRIDALAVFRDHDGGIWLGTENNGIYHIHGNEFEKFGIQEGLSGDYVLRFYQDRENGIWVVTSGGVDYFHPRKITTFSKREGLPGEIIDTVTAGQDNAVWLGSGGLDLLKNGHINKIRLDPGLPGFLAIFEDSFGRVWCGINNDLYRYDQGQFRRVRGKLGGSTHFIVGIAEDSAHDIWAEVSGGSHELIHIHGLQVVETYPEAVIPSARALAAGPNGVLWLGLRNGDLARFHDGSAEVFPSPGGPKSYVYQVLVNPDGTVFATTSAGLVGWKDGVSRLLSSKNGLPCDAVIGAEWDNQGSLWLYTGCGVARIVKEDMNRWWRDDTSIVTPMLLDAFDGAEAGGIPNFNPMARTPDGRLWIANRHMLEVLDPDHLTQNDVIPPVQIEKVIVDRKPYEPNDRLAFPPRLRDLEIDYAAMSFVNPQKVRFRYKLEGRDTVWQEAGVRREAFYTDLPPGTYRFRVIASNNDGVWNETGADLTFKILPSFTQGTWFKAFCLLGLAALVYSAYLLRVRQVTRQLRTRMYERLAERERIARDLHDTFFQGIQGLLLRFHTATSQLNNEDPARRIFEETLKQSDQVMLEGRELVLDLRATVSEPSDLPTAFADFGEAMRQGSSSDFRVVVNGSVRSLHPIVFEELFKIGKEALGNAFRHSGAQSIETELNYEPSELSMRVRDDGTGIESAILRRGRKEGHFGMPGMRERAQKIGAHLDVWSRPGAGTEVELRIAARIAYASEPNGFWLWKLRRLRNDTKEEDSTDERTSVSS
jgi:signal transduction histidine kinase/ligand-binding sensor domain-containing protein